ncbi:aminopeptidase [Flavobacterium pedocola]
MQPKIPFQNKFLILLFINLITVFSNAQHKSEIKAQLDAANKLIHIEQQVVLYNTSNTTLGSIILNDWTNSYSNNNTPLGKRFSDEFVRSFLLAKESDRGNTTLHAVNGQNNVPLQFSRPENHPDLVEITLQNPVNPGESATFSIKYTVKIPNDRFTRFGFTNDEGFVLKNWFLSIARLEADGFIKYSNENLDDVANSLTEYQIVFQLDRKFHLFTDLNVVQKTTAEDQTTYFLNGKERLDFSLQIETKPTFHNYKNETGEVVTNLRDRRLNEIQKALVIDKVTSYIATEVGQPKFEKIVISQTDYDRNPFYGLNQLPAFISPFPDSFLYEIKFLKIYTDKYLKTALNMNPRKDTWIYDGFQSYLIMKYIKDNYPDMKMMGNLSDFWLLKGYNIFRADFNDQYTYIYLLMARKNLDQPIGDDKNTFIRFNEQISGKYRAGLSLNYLDNYLEKNIVSESIKDFAVLNNSRQTDEKDYEAILKNKSGKDIDWFFRTVVETNDLIDFKITKVKKDQDSLKVTIKNKTKTNVPVSLYGVKKDNVVFKQWVENIKNDTIISIPKGEAEKLVLNYNKEIPEFNTRNNWKSLKTFFGNNRPFKLTFFKDLEDSEMNQVFFLPEFTYNYYDGLSTGIRFNNKSFLEKPFIFDVTPTYSSKTQTLIGNFSLTSNKYYRDEDELFQIRYVLQGSTFHYAPDARYTKLTPSVIFRFRENNLRSNNNEYVLLRHTTVNRDQSEVYSIAEENYSVFNLRYGKNRSQLTKHFNYYSDLQLANSFGKMSGELQYRRLFNDNRQVNLRFYSGFFLYRSTTSDFFSFGLDRPTDYMFDYEFLGRTETTGLLSQQFILAEGGFKSKLGNRYANQWISTINASFNIWSWIEVYGDTGIIKSKYTAPEFVYDSGIRFNLVPDYFELYFPVYSKNGWEIAQDNYQQKIRFVITLSPKTLISLFTRKWF